MKKLLFTLFTLLSLSLLGQDVVYNFNTDDESFTRSGLPNLTTSNGNLTTGTITGTGTDGTGGISGGFQQIRTPDGLGLVEANYKILRIVAENSTNNTLWSVVNYDSGSTNAGNGESTNFDMPKVVAGSGFTTFDIAIPVNADNTGTIDRLGLRFRQGSSFDWSGELKVAQMIILNTTLENSFIANADFETAPQSNNWSTGSPDADLTFVTGKEGGSAAQLTFNQDITNQSNTMLLSDVHDFGKTISPKEIIATFDALSNDKSDVNIQITIRTYDASDATVETLNGGSENVDSADTWQNFTYSNKLTLPFNKIQFRVRIKGANVVSGDYAAIDNITASLSYHEAENSWTGGADTDWANIANWTNGVVPSATENANVQVSANNPIISETTAADVNNLEVNSGASLTINGGGSLIVAGTSTGNVTYNRTLATNNWYLVASPVVGETAVDLISNAGDISNNGSEFAIGTYNDGWTYNYSATLGSGSGYAVKKDASGNLPFTGTIQTSDVASTTFDTTDDFNLFGNPYPSYIPANENADPNNNFLTVNTASGQDELKEATIWFWDQATDGYIQINQASPARFIAPSQGFFIQNKGGFGNSFIDFKESMQSHQSTEVFNRSENTRQDINLFLSDGTKNKYTEIYYIDGTTTGFDNGYDSSIFGGVTQEFAVYTEAVANGTGKKLGIQSLPNSELENMIIPVGVISDAGAVSFSVNASNLPQGYKVFLEDKDTGNFIRLDEAGSKYDVTFDNAVQGIGRFFLHTTTSALSTGSFDATNVSAYISEKNNLKIVGIQSGTTQVRLFNILGKQVLNTSFQSKGVDNVILPNVRTGVYIVQIVSEQGTINKKIVIK